MPLTDDRARPLLVTADPDLLDLVLQVAAAAGVDVEVAPDVSAARLRWDKAIGVLLGADIAPAVARAGLAARHRLLVASTGPVDPAVSACALALAAEVVALPTGRAALLEFLLPTTGRALAQVVAVVPGRGGAGASTLACGLAVTAAVDGRRTLLLDGDPLGGGLDLAMGAEDAPGPRWPALASLQGPVTSADLVEALPMTHDVTLLSYDRGPLMAAQPTAMQAALASVRPWTDVVVADVPRSLDAGTELVLRAADLTLLVVSADVRSIAAAVRVASSLRLVADDVRVVVRGPAPSGLRGATVAGILGLELVGRLRSEPGLAHAIEHGEPPARGGRGPLADLSRTVLAALATLPAGEAGGAAA